MRRVTEKMNQAVVERINRMTNGPVSYKVDGKTQVGHFKIYCAYGAYALHRVSNDGGGVQEIIGLCTKRELYERMQAFAKGVERCKE